MPKLLAVKKNLSAQEGQVGSTIQLIRDNRYRKNMKPHITPKKDRFLTLKGQPNTPSTVRLTMLHSFMAGLNKLTDGILKAGGNDCFSL